jgi:hypothetical protein
MRPALDDQLQHDNRAAVTTPAYRTARDARTVADGEDRREELLAVVRDTAMGDWMPGVGA